MSQLSLVDKEQNRIEQLEKLIHQHNLKYFIENSPEISDVEFDQLTEELKKLKPDSPVLFELVGEIGSVKHPTPMLSLDKKYTYEDIKKWVEDIGDTKFLVEPKYDGMAARYQGGQLSTRGDGNTGEDVSIRLPNLKIVGRKLPSDPSTSIYGEIIIPLSYFNEHLASTYKNPRNAVVGIIKSKDVSTTGIKALLNGGVHFVLHDSAKHMLVTKEDLLDEEKWEEILEEIYRTDYPLDGLVLKVTNEDIKKNAGTTLHHEKWAMAYKSPAERKWTKVTQIKDQVGRTGRITSVAVVEPIQLSGATVTNVTLHNFEFVKSSGINIGSKVEVCRSGEVIPFITKVENSSHPLSVILPIREAKTGGSRPIPNPKREPKAWILGFQPSAGPENDKENSPARHAELVSASPNVFSYSPPTHCPICGSILQINGKYIECKNKDCPARKSQEIEYFFKTLGAEELGLKTIERLINEFKIYSILDFYHLDREKIANLEGFGEKSADNILTNIKNTLNKTATEPQLLQALGIQAIGPAGSKWIIQQYGFKSLPTLSVEDLEAVKGIGKVKAQTFVEEINKRWNIVEKLIDLGLRFSQLNSTGKLKGQSFAITGTFQNYKREDLINLIEKNAGTYKTSITKDLTYLIAGKNPGSKLEKAEKMGVKTIDANAFIKLI